MNWKDFISFEPKVCHGKTHIKGTRVLISVILNFLAEKLTINEILEEYRKSFLKRK
ncbi:MAG: hypothetical protein BAJALOKI3v1_20092 [Promethearchaeota archaeon]|jgi:uncharacterized protein (DUF433 family)|nr:MAG: hypothetical protein BAJALOKI3v1_20092 [Candidatus Lokiarchaeota archaeon]